MAIADMTNKKYFIELSLVRVLTVLIGSCVASFFGGQIVCVFVSQTTDHSSVITSLTKKLIEARKLNALTVPLSLVEVKKSSYTGQDRIVHDDDNKQCLVSDEVCRNKDSEYATKGNDFHKQPHCQHLSIDMKNVNEIFLSSKDRLGSMLSELAEQSLFHLLSHNCQDIYSDYINCVGIFLSGHISLGTWPKDGVILLDIVTCESNTTILEMVGLMQKLFGISGNDREAHMIWSYNQRPFLLSNNNDINSSVRSDERRMLSTLELEKDLVIGVQTNFQVINIYDVIEPRFRTRDQYVKSQSHDGSYESSHPEFFRKDRLVYFNGILSSRRYGESAYYEALVHPVMITHQNPKRVAILGGGTGAILREVLKHKTVEQVVMIERDESLMNVSRKYLPEWSDCSDLVGSTPSCFDDPRIEMYIEDVSQWLINHFSEEVTVEKNKEFDVIVVDSIEPDAISALLHTNYTFANALSRALGDTGILVAQAGGVGHGNDLPSVYSGDISNSSIARLGAEGFQSITYYIESHGGFPTPCKFLVAMKARSSRAYWSSSEAELEVSLRKRTIQSTKGENPIQFFDAPTMKTYELPPRIIEDKWCIDNPKECEKQHGFNPDIPNYPGSSFEVGISTIAKGGRGVFAKEFIPNRSYMHLRDCVDAMFLPPAPLSILLSASEYLDTEYYTCFMDGYVDGYGFYDEYLGKSSAAVDPGIFTFLNHGCNGTNNVGASQGTDPLPTPGMRPPEKLLQFPQFHPFQDRHFYPTGCEDLVALKDIQPGEEILDNYFSFGGAQYWDDEVEELQKLCSGGTGSVLEYEQNKVVAEDDDDEEKGI